MNDRAMAEMLKWNGESCYEAGKPGKATAPVAALFHPTHMLLFILAE
jgi:hypothetical protein